MHTKDIGDVGEIAAVKKLKEKGATVMLPFGDNAAYDLVYDGLTLVRAQVKIGRYDDGVIKADLRKSQREKGENVHNTYEEDEIDVYIVYCSETDSVYEIPYNDAPNKSVYLRVEDPDHDNGKIRWAEDYKL